MDSLFFRRYGDHGLVDSLEPKRCSENTTSAAVSGSPFQNLMPLRTLNVQVRPSWLRSYLSATLPTTLPCSSNRSSKSYMAQPQKDSMLIGSIDSPKKSALPKRSVPVGAAAELAGAEVGAADGFAGAGAVVAAGWPAGVAA